MMRFRLRGLALGIATVAICLLLAFMPGSPLPKDQRAFAAGTAAGICAVLVAWGLLCLYPPFRRWCREKMSDPVLMAQQRRYYRDFMPPMIAYIAVMLAWGTLLAHLHVTWLRFLVALLPALLVVLVIRAMVRYVRNADELQRRIELESIGIGAALVGMVYMALGFLQIAGLIAIPGGVAMLWVFPSLCMSYGITKCILARRYS